MTLDIALALMALTLMVAVVAAILISFTEWL